MNDRFKFRVIVEKEVKTFNGTFKGQSIYYCNGFIQTKTKTYFFGNNKRISILNSQIKAINQCTGLKDKNGKLIYEGDIVKDISLNMIFEVGYKKCAFYLENEEHIGYFHELATAYSEKRLEVIGNIYENKELLDERN